MHLSRQQQEQFDRDGFLLFPACSRSRESRCLRQETARLSQIQDEAVIREHTGGVRSIFRVHETTVRTRSGPFRALVRTPRVLGPVRQALGTDEVYVYHTKINTKPAIEGTVWMWHQDYGSWMRDGCPRPTWARSPVMLTDSSEMNGALYVIPGSHKRGRIEPYYDENTSYKFWAVPKKEIISVLKESPAPVSIVGPGREPRLSSTATCCMPRGTTCPAEDRWHIYISFNACANAPKITAESRDDWVVSRNTAPLPIEDDGGILKAA
jgi:ectoine hydroxylase